VGDLEDFPPPPEGQEREGKKPPSFIWNRESLSLLINFSPQREFFMKEQT
jgi:hypothetical protein